ncbi:hypothetical protein GCM10010519_25250 [Streptomyces lactacystinicus]
MTRARCHRVQVVDLIDTAERESGVRDIARQPSHSRTPDRRAERPGGHTARRAALSPAIGHRLSGRSRPPTEQRPDAPYRVDGQSQRPDPDRQFRTVLPHEVHDRQQ